MLDITPDDIAKLSDGDLRQLIGRLCEAELCELGLSPSAVTYGGHQDAADGGIDVRVSLPAGSVVHGFIPKSSSGFQVKKPDMPPKRIEAEIRPGGVLRPSIQKLADTGGAYIIVSSSANVTAAVLERRISAMAESVETPNAKSPFLDFYDQTRVTTWVRRHPGLIFWVLEKVGRAAAGWQSYGPWSNPASKRDAEFDTDNTQRIFTINGDRESSMTAIEGINRIREILSETGRVVRLVGLSGVGKTRLAEALFDRRLGIACLDQSKALYTRAVGDVDPPPARLISRLAADRKRAIVVIDNCPPDLHAEVVRVCREPTCQVSAITIEHDVRDDSPEGTQVFTIAASSIELVEHVLRHRFANISAIDARRLAKLAEGNFRMALALAAAAADGNSLASVSDHELFERLFYQRHGKDPALLRAAEVCSLLYSFDGEDTSDTGELEKLSKLVGQDPLQLHAHIAELMRRDLAQQRSHWRAILPHALANYLSERALQGIPRDRLLSTLAEDDANRLLESFSRRIGLLHRNKSVIRTACEWLGDGGLLSPRRPLNEFLSRILMNIAPVLPEPTLTNLEMREPAELVTDTFVRGRVVSVLRSIAFEPDLFERCVSLLAELSAVSENVAESDAGNALQCLFRARLSGTKAPVEVRVAVMVELLHSSREKIRAAGLVALEALLKSSQFVTGHRFEFGSRLRDYGYYPELEDFRAWFRAVIGACQALLVEDLAERKRMQKVIASSFGSLWTSTKLYDDLEQLMLALAEKAFSPEAWIGVRTAFRSIRASEGLQAGGRLRALEKELRPVTLYDQITSVVLGDMQTGVGLDDLDEKSNGDDDWQKPAELSAHLGEKLAGDDAIPEQLISGLLSSSFSSCFHLGKGFGRATERPMPHWFLLLDSWRSQSFNRRGLQFIIGYLKGLSETSLDCASRILDMAASDSNLGQYLPSLQWALPLDDRGIQRLKSSLSNPLVPASEYPILGANLDEVSSSDFVELCRGLTAKEGGDISALQLIHWRIKRDERSHRATEAAIFAMGREVLSLIEFGSVHHRYDDYRIADVVRICSVGEVGVGVARTLSGKLLNTKDSYLFDLYDHKETIEAICDVHPAVLLDSLFDGSSDNQIQFFIRQFDDNANPFSKLPDTVVLDWCAKDPGFRCRAAAAVVHFLEKSDVHRAGLTWTPVARTLIEISLEPAETIAVFVGRFQPNGWSGSLADILESRSTLLDQVEIVRDDLDPFITLMKEELRIQISRERERELLRSRSRSDGFE